MELNQKSIHAKLYREFYNTEVLPDNLCPFFWKLALAWLCSPVFFIFLFPIKRGWTLGLIIGWISKILFAIIVIGCIAFFFYANYHLIKYWLQTYAYDNEAAFFAGFIDSYILLCASWGYIKGKLKKQKRQYIVTEFIKAKYGKYCPQITWN